MNEERMEVLRMIAEKKITVDEGERLLKALEDRERRPSAGREEPRGRDRVPSLIGDLLGNVGSMMQGLVSDALGGFGLVIPGRDSLAEEALEGGGVRVAPGEILEIYQRGGDLELTPSPDDRWALASGSSPQKVQVLRGNHRVVVVCRGGARALIPSTAGAIKVSTAGGSLRGIGFSSPLEVRSMGGEVALVGITRRVDAKTMGGTLHLGVEALEADSRAETLGGDVDVEFGPTARARVQASTLGGSVRVAPELGGASREWTMPGEQVVLEIGGAGDSAPPALELKTAGGSVHLRRKP